MHRRCAWDVSKAPSTNKPRCVPIGTTHEQALCMSNCIIRERAKLRARVLSSRRSHRVHQIAAVTNGMLMRVEKIRFRRSEALTRLSLECPELWQFKNRAGVRTKQGYIGRGQTFKLLMSGALMCPNRSSLEHLEAR